MFRDALTGAVAARAKPETKFITPPNYLRAKVTRSFVDPDEPLRAADAALDRLAGPFRQSAEQQIRMMQDMLEAVAAGSMSPHKARRIIREMAYELQCTAGTFGYASLSDIAGGILSVLRRRTLSCPTRVVLIQTFLEAMGWVLDHNVRGAQDKGAEKLVTLLTMLANKLKEAA